MSNPTNLSTQESLDAATSPRAAEAGGLKSGWRLPAVHEPGILDNGTDRVLAIIAAACAAILVAGMALHALHLNGPSYNSYGALAQSFLHGRLDIDRCLESDCAVYRGHTYIIFPPLPAMLALPFVAVAGAGFKYFGVLAIMLAAVTLLLWLRIFKALGLDQRRRPWLLAALALASPMFGVTLGANSVWLLAQSDGLFFTTAALWAVICKRDVVLAAALLGCAFLCRQMSLLWFPALLALSLSWKERGFALERSQMVRIAAGCAVLAGFVAIYWLYNWARFGDIFETGYRFMIPSSNFLSYRVAEYGLFSRHYFLQNAIYLFFSGPHVDFTGHLYLTVEGLDSLGTSLLSASPWVLLAAYIRFDRLAAILLASILLIAGITLFYHGNGFEQMNMQRFTLDWLPLLLVLMARSPDRPVWAALPLLVTWGVALNFFAFLVVWRFGLSIPAGVPLGVSHQ